MNLMALCYPAVITWRQCFTLFKFIDTKQKRAFGQRPGRSEASTFKCLTRCVVLIIFKVQLKFMF